MTKGNTRWKEHPGIKVDIFPYDNIPESEHERKTFYRKLRILNQLYIIRSVKVPYMELKGMKKIIFHAGCYVVYAGLKILGISTEKLVDAYNKCAKKYEGKTSYYTLLNDITPDAWMIKEDEWTTVIKKKFEDIEIDLPIGIDTILRRGYGDYMQLPPEEERVGHDLAKVET